MACAAVVGAVERLDLEGRAARGKRGTTLWAGARQGLKYVRSLPLLRVLAVVAVVSQLMEQVLDFQLFAAAQDYYQTSPDSIAAFMGWFYGVTGAAAMVSQLLFSGRILSRFGSAPAVATMPAWVVLGSLVFFAFPSFGILVLLRGGVRVMKQALASPARAQIQTAIPSIRRAQAGALIRGVLAPLFYAAGGGALALLPEHSDIRWLSFPAAVLGLGGVLVVVRRLRPSYVSALRRSVDRRRLDLDAAAGARSGVLDAEVVKEVAADARSADEDRALFAVSLLGSLDPVQSRDALRQATSHTSPAVRARALDVLAAMGDPANADVVLAALQDDPTTEVREACLGALAACGVSPPPDVIHRLLQDTDPEVRAFTLACLSRVEGAAGDAEKNGHSEGLARMFEASAATERVAAARAVGVAGLDTSRWVERLAMLLDDPEVEVRAAALRAVGRLGAPELIPAVVSAFSHPETTPAAFDAFASVPDESLRGLEAMLRTAPAETVSRVAAALAPARGPVGDAVLAHLVDHTEPEVRHRAARALAARTGGRPPASVLPPERVERALKDELRRGYGYYALLVGIAKTDGVDDFDIEPGFQSVADEIQTRIRQSERRLFGILELVTERKLVRQAEMMLRHRDARRAARAVELIEHALSPSLGALLVPFFERRPLRMRLEAAEKHFTLPEGYLTDPLTGIMGLGDAHLRRCALLCYEERIRKEFPQAYAEDAPMLALTRRIHFLRSVPLFQDLSGEDLAQVAAIAEPIDHPDEHIIFHKGDPGDAMFLVVSGRVAVRDGDEDINSIGPREFFGELAVLDDEPRSADVVCVGDTELLRIAGPDLEELMERRPEIAREVIRVITRRLRDVTARMTADS